MKTLITIALFLLLPGVKVRAQSSASAHVSVTILEPAGVTRLNDLSFGSFSMGAGPGAIELSAQGLSKIKGGVRLQTAADSAATLALFRVAHHNQAYSLSLPEADIIGKRKAGEESITVGSFHLTISQDGAGVPTHTIAVGATLKAGACQPPGFYEPVAPLTIIVHYN